MRQKIIEVYCAFCRSKREIYRKKYPSLVNFLQALGLAGVVNFLVFREVDARVFVVFLVMLMVIEIGILVRGMIALPCPYCGFDPVIYVRDQKRACERVKSYLDQRRQDPQAVMSKYAPPRLPILKKKRPKFS